MKHLATSCLVFFLLLTAMGCSSSKKAAEEAVNPMLGAWALEGTSTSVVQFMSSGDLMLEQGDMLAAINRFQNTNRAKYRTRLLKEASYEFNGTDQLTLNVMADWTGKGTGATKAEDKSVASAIVFAVEDMGDMLKLTKVNMTQSGSGTDNTNSDEELSFSLKKM
jgi:hypothetical protein